MPQQAIWNGTEKEALDLLAVIERHCACKGGPVSGVGAACAPHRMLLEQRVLDGLLFARRIVARLTGEERLERRQERVA